MYLETMENILGGADKTIIDSGSQGQGVVPYLPLTELPRSRPSSANGGASSGGNQ
jgi:membrane protease subunit HflK